MLGIKVRRHRSSCHLSDRPFSPFVRPFWRVFPSPHHVKYIHWSDRPSGPVASGQDFCKLWRVGFGRKFYNFLSAV